MDDASTAAGRAWRHTLQTTEDRELKERLDLAVERMKDVEPELVRAALELLRKELRESTSSMTSVPAPLKFLGPQFADMKAVYAGMPASENKRERVAVCLICVSHHVFCSSPDCVACCPRLRT